MNTPIADFVDRYAGKDAVRLHMPGHKGKPILGCEPYDITEIAGADALYEAGGIILESEKNAAALFGSGRTLFSTEGSSQCIRAMVYLAVTCRRPGAAPLILAGRNAHKAFLYALALTGADVRWLLPEAGASLYSCPVAPTALERALAESEDLPCAVYITSPDYLGGMEDIASLAAVCRRHDVPLLVDDAHGAYMHFLEDPLHPLDLGAAMCCDSAHKTLPVLTGGACLHIAKDAPDSFRANAKTAMALFGSTSPSYLILQSLDLCNRYLSDGYGERLAETVGALENARSALRERGFDVLQSDPLRLSIRGDGAVMAARLREGGIEPEFADRDHVVMMVTPEIGSAQIQHAADTLGTNPEKLPDTAPVLPALPEKVLTPREALFSPHEIVPVSASFGRICGAPTVSCPPAIPISVSGERIGQREIELFRYYGVETVDVLMV